MATEQLNVPENPAMATEQLNVPENPARATEQLNVPENPARAAVQQIDVPENPARAAVQQIDVPENPARATEQQINVPENPPMAVVQQIDVPRNPAKDFNDYFRFKLGRDPPSDARNTLLVVTTLIVAVTFQAAINPPGGVWQDDMYSPANCTAVTSDNNCTIIRHAGTSVLYYRDKRGYNIFVFVNTLAFSASTSTILCLLLDSPFQTEVLLAIYSMNVAFAVSVASVRPPKTMKWWLISVAFILPYISRVFSNIIKRYR